MRERQIIDLWQRLARPGTVLTTEDNESVKIIYPGRVNHHRGADFSDAVMATSRGILTGDIEVHVKSSDWQAHQHHRNPDYNRVILHVVMNRLDSSATQQNGRNVPTLTLDKYRLRLSDSSPVTMSCAGNRRPDDINALLDRAGDERFLAKSDRFQADIPQMTASQCLYQGVMGALGYSQNKLPFRELARRLPLLVLEAKNAISAEGYLSQQQALLLGAAGLLPSQRHLGRQDYESDEPSIGTLENLWTSYHPTPAMPVSAWNLFRVRPSNFPVRRLVAMSYLMLRYRETGMLNGMVNLVKATVWDKAHHRLAAGLTVTAGGYWARHFDFGSPTRVTNPSLLGAGCAAAMVGNVLLPFTLAWSQSHSETELADKCRELYRRQPKLASNSIEQHMIIQLGLNSSLVNSARRQQGLLHIYQTRCTQGECNTCPLAAAA